MNTPDLFASAPDPAANLLPFDGIVNDYGAVFAPDEADGLLRYLLDEIPWRHDEAVMYGKRIVTARQVAWYGDAAFDYRYSGATRTALPWTETLLAIKARAEERIAAISPTRFNSCLLNLYADGAQGMAWHSDDEAELGPETVIASLSFGATRTFALRHRRSGEKREMRLQHGQLIVMCGATQSHWQHALMKSARVHAPRVNLTFRTFRSLSPSS
ncbi:2OG-Fe(II) oxygenase [Vandammella animalimorsus]|uniref:2OG-Fe(II) oxygenase n=1 Tax=Vandammella animalimorsus TaxID=2029117 RepID=A0A2A2AN66_9BURK|nr:alpha-ketoglutarate-dependent dioxygenase AlkB [Vandammella animalimorsus]PAT40030.1 2OG-Fe(II) oxygenase [Vandammella animalimorsus]